MIVYKMKCEDATWVAQYQRMKSAGIRDAEVDKLDGTSDGNLTCDGIIETALTHERFYEDMKKVVGRRVPWQVSEETKRERGVVAKIVKDSLARQGYKPTDISYKRFADIAMYYYLFAPRHEDIAWLKKYDPKQLDTLIKYPLEAMGFHDLHIYVMEHGGMGFADRPEEGTFEPTAEEVVRNRIGACTSRSTVIHPWFAAAGSDPFYADIAIEAMTREWPKIRGMGNAKPPVTPKDYLRGHIAVGVPNGAKPMYFEPNDHYAGIDYHAYARRISLREMYQVDIANLAINIFTNGNQPPDELTREGVTLERLIEGAKSLGESPSLGLIFATEGHISQKKGEKGAAIRSFEEALKKHPQSHATRMTLCNLHLNSGDLEKAQACLLKLPENATQRSFWLGLIALRRRENAKARDFFKKSLEQGADPHNANYQIAMSYIAEDNLPKAAEHMQLALTSRPNSVEGGVKLADILSQQKKWQEAVDVLKVALAVDSTSTAALMGMTQALVNLGHLDMAKSYYARYLISFAMSLQEEPPDATLDEWFAMSEKLGTWMELLTATKIVWQNETKNASIAFVHIEAACRAGDVEYAKSLMNKIATGSLGYSLPIEHIKRLKRIAELTGDWADVAKFSAMLQQEVPAYSYLMLLSAVRSKNEKIVAQAVKLANEWVDAIADVKPSDRSLDAIKEIQKEVCALPPDVTSNLAVKPVISRLSAIITETYVASGLPQLPHTICK